MAARGNWLTPIYLGRYGLYKPPLIAWLAGASAKLLGGSAFAVRLPVMLAGAWTALLVFWWGRRSMTAVLLLVSSHLWFVINGLCLTDGLLTACVTAAAFALVTDPRLDGRTSRYTFIIAIAGAVMAKSVAGALPVFVLLAYCAVAKRGERPPWGVVLGVLITAGLLVLPWCVYQLAVHGKWFWNEFVLSEIFTYGVSSPIQTTQENQVLFYLKRLFLLDPVIAVLAVPGIWYAVRRRQLVVLAWIAVVFATAFFWSYRNVTYLAPALPALAIAGAGVLRGRVAVMAAAAVLVVKAAFPAQPWGIELRPDVLHPSVTLLDDYARMQRGRELILVNPFEGFYSATLPLPKVRYCFVSPAGVPPQGPLDLHAMGILVSAEEFGRIDELRPEWRARLREWKLDSDEPIATAIIPRSGEELAAIVAAHPEADFLLPESYRGAAVRHTPSASAGGFFFALGVGQPFQAASRAEARLQGQSPAPHITGRFFLRAGWTQSELSPAASPAAGAAARAAASKDMSAAPPRAADAVRSYRGR
jgi:hypothetical protein